VNTGNLYFTEDTYIKIYNETGASLFLGSSGNFRSLIVSNESWQDYYSDFTGYGLSGFDDKNAGVILSIDDSTKNNNQNRFNIHYGVNETGSITGNYHKQLIKIRPQIPQNVGYLNYFSNDNAWASYDVSTGMMTGSLTPNNIFSYAIEIAVSGILSTSNFYYTGDIDISTQTGQAYVFNLEKNPILYTNNYSITNIRSFNDIKEFCKQVVGCEEAEEPDPLEVCYSGELTNTTGFQSFLSGFSKLVNTVVINRPLTNNALIASSTGEEIRYTSTVYSGYILYNNWKSGDYIQWDLYNFDYINLYQSFHLGNYPPYSNTGFRLYYPNDFNSLDLLVEKLNEKVDFLKDYPVWYPYECLKDTPSGIFVTGRLMEFNKNNSSTGSLPISHFNNRIDFISLRSYPQLEDKKYLSYGISIFSPTVPQKTLFNGWNYLVPTNIQLEGFNINSQDWEILDIRDNLSGDFAKAEKIKKPMGSLPSILKEGKGEDEEELPEDENEDGDLPAGLSGCKDVIFTDRQRNINFNKNPLCPPKISFRDVIVTAPKEECKQKFVDKDGNVIQKISNAELCAQDDTGGADGGGGDEGEGEGAGGGMGGDGGSVSAGDYYIIRTGWNLSLNDTNNNNYYDKYKVSLSGFISLPESKLYQKDSFFIKQVNLYTLDKTGFSPHEGPSLCSIGADYTIDVSGLLPIEISGIWNYNISPEESGIYRFFKTPFSRKIEDDEKRVKFNKVSGEIISPSGTGFLSISGYGVGNVYYENTDYYFYNPALQSVYFKETLTGLVTGFGRLSGNKLVVKQDIINQEVLFGGRLANSNFRYHEIVSDGAFSSVIENVEYVNYDVLGFYPITGQITGNTINGRLDVSDTIIKTGSPFDDVFAYYPVPTGFTVANLLFIINYNHLNNFDFISINDNTIIYHQDPFSYPPPTYFNSNQALISIINNSTNAFASTGQIIGSNIFLNSTVSGESGNIGLSSNSTGVQIINRVSGLNIYPRLYKIVTERIIQENEDPLLPSTISFNKVIKDPIITGNISDFILATGFYSNNLGSGNIIGDVLTFTGVRTFFDVWDIATGSLGRNYSSFLGRNFTSGNSFYRNLLFGSSPKNVNLRSFYQNYLNTSLQESPDVADLIIKDLNNPNYSQTGIVFRLNGIK
jgi:hypothetical protein